MYRCRARLWRTPDDKEARFITVTAAEGKAVEGIDGDRDFKSFPPVVNGLRVLFTVKRDAAGIALRADATYRTFVVTIVGGQTFITASTSVNATMTPGVGYDAPLDVNGVSYTLTLWVDPLG